ncbi:methyltransferase, partial [Pseudomonas syringae pv. actinidiae]
MNKALIALSLATLLLPGISQAASPDAHISDEQYATVLKGPWRAKENSARDTYRHPQQTLQFFGVRADQTVIEITPGGGW